VRWTGESDTAEVIKDLQSTIAEFDFKSARSAPSLDELSAGAADQRSKEPQRPRASEDPRVLLPPGGTIRLDDKFYVSRDADAQIDKTARLSGQTVVIKAPRQMGKSSLLIRYLAGCKSAEKRIAFIDFQSFSELDLAEFPALARRVAQVLRRQFGLPPDNDASLNFPSQLDFTFYVEDKLLRVIGTRITIANGRGRSPSRSPLSIRILQYVAALA
jgi:hypothetical protein